MASFEAMRAGYHNLWNAMHLTREMDSNRVAEGMLADRSQYQLVEDETGVPWFWVAIVHQRESNRNFTGVLHNGQKVIGNGKKTTIVPVGRGPFNSWHEAAIDAVKYKELDRVDDWSLERCLYEFERYNGFGYNNKINSPYVWAGTSKQQRGKYVSDGNYDSSHWDTQLGCAAMFKSLVNLSSEVEAQLLGDAPDVPDESAETPEEQPVVVLTSFTVDVLVNEILSRENVAEVHVIRRKT